jgi:pilus assembly protein CpaC
VRNVERGVSTPRRARSSRATLVRAALFALLASIGMPRPALRAQEPEVLTVARGKSQVISSPTNLERVLIGNPEIADVVAVSARDIVVNGISPGTTTLLFWEAGGPRRTYTVRVTLDAETIGSELSALFPDEDLDVSAVGNTLILTGQTQQPGVAERALALAQSIEGDATILDHMVVPDRGQVLLRVRVAEVSRSAMQDLGAQITRVDPLNPRGDDEGVLSTGNNPPAGNFLNTPIGPDVTFSDAVNFYLFHDASNVTAFIRALREDGNFKSLAEPNLMTIPDETASFLAGGEFPYPVVQAGSSTGAITIQFQEFGVRLNFTPTLMNSGAIRLAVEPEVSSLDFTNGLTLAGFQIPALLSRRASTVVEVQDGQTFAIAGLMDNSLAENVRKVPLLGDIPILGALFKSTSFQRNQTELLVLVTPYLVTADMEAPSLPTGEIESWGGPEFRQFSGDEPASTGTDE